MYSKKKGICSICGKEVEKDSGALVAQMSDSLKITYTHAECCKPGSIQQMVIMKTCGNITNEMMEWLDKNSTDDFTNINRNEPSIKIRTHPDFIRMVKEFKQVKSEVLTPELIVISVPTGIKLEVVDEECREWVRPVHSTWLCDPVWDE